MCKRHENIDNKHMEQQIVSMLENVLNDESEDEVKTKEAIFDKNINDCKDNFISLDEKEFWPKAIKENQLAPKLYVNDMPFHRLKGTPSEKYKRKEKKYNTADPCYNQNTITLGGNKQRLMNGGYLGASLTQNISLNYRSNCNPLSFSTLEGLQYYNSNSSSLTNSSSIVSNNKNNIKTNEDIPPDELYWTEFDKILEHRVRPKDELDAETYELLKGKIFNVLMTQNGSRVLQKALRNTECNIISKVFDEIFDKIHILMTDSYANYFCPKFFSLLKRDQRSIYLMGLNEHICDIAVSKIGTYPLQSVIDQLKHNEEKMIVADSLQGKILEMCLDPQGTHVVEKIITCFEEGLIEDYYNIIIDNMLTLADNVNGLCVCKKIIIHAINIKTMKRIREKLSENAIFLIQNVYGNYVIQMAIEKWSIDFCLPIVKQFHNNIYFLSMEKYSSNVIEKCFEKGYEILYAGLIDEIFKDSKIINLIKSPYGNYVIQKALKLSKGVYRKKLIGLILKDIKKLEDKKLIAKWKLIVNSIQSVNKNIIHPVNVSSSSSTIHSEASLNSPNYNFNAPNLLSLNYNHYRYPRSLVGSPQFNSPYLMMNGNYLNNNNVFPNYVNNHPNNFMTPFSLNYTTNNNNYYL